MNALLRALLGYGEPAPDAPPISPIENNPVVGMMGGAAAQGADQ